MRILPFIVIFLLLPFQALAGALPVEAQFEPFLWNLHNTGQPWRMEKSIGKAGKPGADIHLLEAWKIVDAAPDVLVALIDGGFDLSHPDLVDEIDRDHAYDFLRNTRDFQLPQQAWQVHGNLVAGVIGANGENAIGITGISRKSKLLPLEAIPNEGNESDEVVARAIRYAVDSGARIINCSFGKYSTSDQVHAAIEYARGKNVLLVAGVGNDHKNVDKNPLWPAGYSREFENVISVAASNREDMLWDGSNFGLSVDVAAPGSEIFSTGATFGAALDFYFTVPGTSLAAPHVTGVAALMWQLDPSLQAKEIKQIILSSVDVLTALKGKVKSGGRLNALKALQAVMAKKSQADLAACDLHPSKTILVKTKNGYTAEWTLPLAGLSVFAPDTVLSGYQAWVRANTKLDARGILQKALAVWQKALSELGPNDSKGEYESAVTEIQKILAGQGGTIRPMQCLEAIPFAEFLQVNDLKKFPQEFQVVIFRNGESLKLVGDFYHTNGSIDAEGTGASASMAQEQAALLQQGWTLFAHLHNHPFVFHNRYGDIGGDLVPSDPDLQSYKSLKPEHAWITNGVETIDMLPADYNNL